MIGMLQNKLTRSNLRLHLSKLLLFPGITLPSERRCSPLGKSIHSEEGGKKKKNKEIVWSNLHPWWTMKLYPKFNWAIINKKGNKKFREYKQNNLHLPGCPNSFPMKFKYPSPPNPMVISLIILCNAIPRSTRGVDGLSKAIKSYISWMRDQNMILKALTNTDIIK